VLRDADGAIRFSADFRNVADLEARLESLSTDHGGALRDDRAAIVALYEDVFDHRSFTGRSGGMFGFEGLGCIYWHMVSKLLLAVQENFFAALNEGSPPDVVAALGQAYYRVREGIGFNKTPAEYGAFPVDPYSHTPKHAGAQQPGMTGQVKEEVLTRFGELGVRVNDGRVRFDTRLLRANELDGEPSDFRYLDVDATWQQIAVPASGLAFTWCQVPIVYVIDLEAADRVTLTLDDGSRVAMPAAEVDADYSSEIFRRSGKVRRIDLRLRRESLFGV